MNPNEYTDEQKKDIQDRVQKAKNVLEELNLRPAAQVFKVAIDESTFADKVLPYLQDTKYEGILSPIQDNEDI